MQLFRRSILILPLCLLAACSSEPERPRPIGQAFAGPASLQLRSELGVRSAVVATARHGERLDIIQVRRRFYKVRNAAGAEGWVDGRNLLSTAQMDLIDRVSKQAQSLPSQGKATVYDPLNVHTGPNRQSPTIAQMAPGAYADVVGHKVAPRAAYKPVGTLVPPQPTPPPRKPKKRTSSKSLLPPPPAPAPPANWLDLSKSSLPPEPEPSAGAEPEAPKPLPRDDWSLVRLADGKAGWVLTRMLVMGIPDEVAQYAEGHRITSYFALGEVDAGGQKKRHYLWTTLSKTLEPYEFDSFRVFIYNARRSRYETAYIERNLRGYFPVVTGSVEVREGKETLTVPSFTVIVEDKDGQLVRKTFSFQLYRVRMVSKTPVGRDQIGGQSAAGPPGPGGESNGGSLAREVEEKVKKLFR
ncbi:MAG: SH3 domain-containing protein [Bryobacterales bacterium]|nr:SH3 domain-containing protein [Bryobacterales bacterium]